MIIFTDHGNEMQIDILHSLLQTYIPDKSIQKHGINYWIHVSFEFVLFFYFAGLNLILT